MILDFTNVKDGGNFNTKRVPAGDYLAKVTKVIDAPTKKKDDGSGGDPQWTFTVELVDKYSDRKFPYRCKLEANQLWKIRNLFIAGGIVIPKKKMKVDPNKAVGRLIAVSLDDDEYDGKMQSVISQVFPASELDDAGTDTDDVDENEEEDDEEEEEEPAPAPARRKKAAPEPEPEEDEEDEEEAEDDEEEEEEEPAPPVKARAKASIPAQRKASPTATKTRAKAKPVVEDDELEELDLTEI
jgi:hypothetical protein